MPYAPGIQYRGDEYVAQGNQAAYAALSQGLQGMISDSKKSSALSRTIDAYADDLPEDAAKALKAKNKTWSLQDREGFMQFHAMQLQQQQVNAQVQETQARAEALRAAQQEKIDEASGLSEFAKTLSGMTPSNDDGTFSAKDYVQAMGDTSAKLNPRAQAALLKQVLPSVVPSESLNSSVWEDPKTGFRIFSRGKTSIPTGVDPEQVKAAGGPLISPDGDYYHDGKKWVPVKQTGAPAGSKFVNMNGTVALVSPDNRILNWKMGSPLAQIVNGDDKTAAQPAAAPAAAAEAPAPDPNAAKVVTPELAKQYLKDAKGDKEKARAKAKADGYTF
jgi:hypothetical protein